MSVLYNKYIVNQKFIIREFPHSYDSPPTNKQENHIVSESYR